MILDNPNQLHASWQSVIGTELNQPYMQALHDFLNSEKAKGKTIFPSSKLIFNAFNQTPFNNVKVVIIGQDPYHGPNQAHGLSFSVPDGVKHPPSLVNLFKELASDLGPAMSGSGDLTPWAKQGVLLLNATLTVEQSNAGSHQKKGWETFTDAAINALNMHRSGLVFVLWGNYAQKKGAFIDEKKHLVIKSPHPSPLSAHRGFFGTNLFSKVNTYLTENDKAAINWAI